MNDGLRMHFKHGWVQAHLTEKIGYEDDELYKLHLHAPKSDMNKLWAELRESLDNEGAGYSILIGKYRIRGPPPHCLAWKNKQ